MPFRRCSVMSEREEFCRLASRPGANRRELCRRFGISRTCGYRWLARYGAEGPSGLQDRSRRPRSSPVQTASSVEAAVLAVRAAHPTWGGRKIRRRLQDLGEDAVPAASTVTVILRRHGCLDGARVGEARAYRRFEADAPNDLWQMDFKGHVAMAEGRLHPLTVLDDHSRYNILLEACADERDETVRGHLTRAFRRYGLPWRMLADNGSPWGSAGGELTRLAVWLLDLDIRLSHGRPYHPQTQGKEERFHRTLKGEVLAGRVLRDLGAAQAALDRWREVYNTRRPHEAIGLATPASRYAESLRAMPDTIAPPEYEPEARVRTVGQGGQISVGGRRWRCPQALVGKRVALRATDQDGLFDLCYRTHVLTQLDLRQTITPRVQDVPEHLSTMSPV
jgi:transposase InsO family protein